ncbi:MAG TPA: hypothetical protein VFR85_01720 [Anaeromyxobacteraceae bacterium]|nr:hypothetical protein [Anaeromyxobacteraceae bacterium]
MPTPSLRRTAVVIWGALVGGVAIFTGVALLVPLGRTEDPELAAVLLLVALGMAALSVGLSFWLPRRIRPAGAVTTPEQLALTRTVIAGALCEGPALFALVGLMMARDASMLLPWLLSLGALLAHFPSASRWERLGAGASGEGPRPGASPGAGSPNRMVR